MVRMTEIVPAANHIHASFQGLNFASQGARSPDKAIKTLAKGGIEALDESGIDPACTLRLLDEGLDHRFTALHDAPRDVQLSIHSLLDDLHNGRGEFDTPEDFYNYWRKYPFRVSAQVQRQLDRLVRLQRDEISRLQQAQDQERRGRDG